jgi:hypothetical protein
LIGSLASVVRDNPLASAVEGAPAHLNWPLCIAVHDTKFLGFRHLGGLVDNPMCFCAADFSRQTPDSEERDLLGIETGYFLQFYGWLLREGRNAMQSHDLLWWFNRLALADGAKVWITTDGVIHRGPVG